MKRVSITIKGRVQGVFFRKYTVNKALELGLSGFVKNLPDESVYAEAEGEETGVQLFVQWCHQGSPLSRVDEVKTHELPSKGGQGFVISR